MAKCLMNTSVAIRPYASDLNALIGFPRVIPPPSARTLLVVAITHPNEPCVMVLLADPSFAVIAAVFSAFLMTLVMDCVGGDDVLFPCW